MQNQVYQIPQQNSVILVGRLTRDPELKRTTTSKSVCRFDIAMSSRIKDQVTGEWRDSDPTFVPIIVWGDQADRCNDRLKKGMPLSSMSRTLKALQLQKVGEFFFVFLAFLQTPKGLVLNLAHPFPT